MAVLVTLLFAFSWQSFVAETHQHLLSDTGTTITLGKSAGGEQQKPAKPSPLDPANCPVCREIAHAGSYLLPTPVSIDAPAPLFFWFATATLLGLALASRSHRWQSRAPPLRLQA